MGKHLRLKRFLLSLLRSFLYTHFLFFSFFPAIHSLVPFVPISGYIGLNFLCHIYIGIVYELKISASKANEMLERIATSSLSVFADRHP